MNKDKLRKALECRGFIPVSIEESTNLIVGHVMTENTLYYHHFEADANYCKIYTPKHQHEDGVISQFCYDSPAFIIDLEGGDCTGKESISKIIKFFLSDVKDFLDKNNHLEGYNFLYKGNYGEISIPNLLMNVSFDNIDRFVRLFKNKKFNVDVVSFPDYNSNIGKLISSFLRKENLTVGERHLLKYMFPCDMLSKTEEVFSKIDGYNSDIIPVVVFDRYLLSNYIFMLANNEFSGKSTTIWRDFKTLLKEPQMIIAVDNSESFDYFKSNLAKKEDKDLQETNTELQYKVARIIHEMDQTTVDNLYAVNSQSNENRGRVKLTKLKFPYWENIANLREVLCLIFKQVCEFERI